MFTVIQCTNPHFTFPGAHYLLSPSLEFSVSPLRILFNQSHHVDDVTDANTHEQPQGRQHRLTPHLPSLEPALTASCFVCLVKVPLHILRQGHALAVCPAHLSLHICRTLHLNLWLISLTSSLCALEIKQKRKIAS